jgi:hypothetical protein
MVRLLNFGHEGGYRQGRLGSPANSHGYTDEEFGGSPSREEGVWTPVVSHGGHGGLWVQPYFCGCGGIQYGYTLSSCTSKVTSD